MLKVRWLLWTYQSCLLTKHSYASLQFVDDLLPLKTSLPCTVWSPFCHRSSIIGRLLWSTSCILNNTKLTTKTLTSNIWLFYSDRVDFCYIIRKLAVICAEPNRKIVFEDHYGPKCSEILDVHKKQGLCLNENIANKPIIASRDQYLQQNPFALDSDTLIITNILRCYLNLFD